MSRRSEMPPWLTAGSPGASAPDASCGRDGEARDGPDSAERRPKELWAPGFDHPVAIDSERGYVVNDTPGLVLPPGGCPPPQFPFVPPSAQELARPPPKKFDPPLAEIPKERDSSVRGEERAEIQKMTELVLYGAGYAQIDGARELGLFVARSAKVAQMAYEIPGLVDALMAMLIHPDWRMTAEALSCLGHIAYGSRERAVAVAQSRSGLALAKVKEIVTSIHPGNTTEDATWLMGCVMQVAPDSLTDVEENARPVIRGMTRLLNSRERVIAARSAWVLGLMAAHSRELAAIISEYGAERTLVRLATGTCKMRQLTASFALGGLAKGGRIADLVAANAVNELMSQDTPHAMAVLYTMVAEEPTLLNEHTIVLNHKSHDNRFFCLHHLAELGAADAIALAISHGADINVQTGGNTVRDEVAGDTPAHIAARRCRPEALEILRRAGADFEIKNELGQTAADIAPPSARLVKAARPESSGSAAAAAGT